MFESAELGHTVDDAQYAKDVKKLRADLLEAQYALLERKDRPVIVLVNGVDGAGKGETVNLLSEWLDPRHVRSRAFAAPSEDERLRPRMWRFWVVLPPKGRIGIFFGNWYTDPIVERAMGRTNDERLGHEIEHIRAFEKLLADDGAVLVKLWFHLSKKAQKKRLQKLEGDKLTRWRVTPQDWKNWKRYDDFASVSERVLRETSTGEAPWLVLDGSDANYRALTAGRALLSALEGVRRGKAKARKQGTKARSLVRSVSTAGIIDSLTFEERISKEKYATKIQKVQARLGKLARKPAVRRDHGVAVVFEGMDAAGKGGAIRRITQALDARHYNVIPIAAPTEEERAQPYLWRFWRQVPKKGQVVIYDRSWYGRVLVERVERFATEEEWTRAYREINDFEEQLVEHGVVVVKLWLAITKGEQLDRFKEREEISFKKFKITGEDWRNRKKWDAYVEAAGDMIDRTSTEIAPWHLIEANDKHLARVRAIETLCDRIEHAI